MSLLMLDHGAFNELEKGVRAYIESIFRHSYWELANRCDELGIAIPDNIITQFADIVRTEVHKAHYQGDLFGDFGYEVDLKWNEHVREQMRDGVPYEEFNANIGRYIDANIDWRNDPNATMEIYQIVLGFLDDGEWEEYDGLDWTLDEREETSWVFLTIEDALRFIMEHKYDFHTRIFHEWLTIEDTEIPGGGPDAMVYPPRSNQNPTDKWLYEDFDMRKHRINDDGSLSPWVTTWRDLLDERFLDNADDDFLDEMVPSEILACL